nr:cell wall protein DAN4-like [Procambarus clarkii]
MKLWFPVVVGVALLCVMVDGVEETKEVAAAKIGVVGSWLEFLKSYWHHDHETRPQDRDDRTGKNMDYNYYETPMTELIDSDSPGFSMSGVLNHTKNCAHVYSALAVASGAFALKYGLCVFKGSCPGAAVTLTETAYTTTTIPTTYAFTTTYTSTVVPTTETLTILTVITPTMYSTSTVTSTVTSNSYSYFTTITTTITKTYVTTIIFSPAVTFMTTTTPTTTISRTITSTTSSTRTITTTLIHASTTIVVPLHFE